MYLKQSRLNRVKNGITCSKKCANILKSQYMKNENNHQFGLIGDKNSNSKGEIIYNQNGYKLIYCEGHPYPNDKSNKCARILEHRRIIEENYQLFDSNYFEEINN